MWKIQKGDLVRHIKNWKCWAASQYLLEFAFNRISCRISNVNCCLTNIIEFYKCIFAGRKKKINKMKGSSAIHLLKLNIPNKVILSDISFLSFYDYITANHIRITLCNIFYMLHTEKYIAKAVGSKSSYTMKLYNLIQL